jgi:hypothetical protein
MKGNDPTGYLQKPSRRRILSLSAGALTTGVAGCTGTPDEGGSASPAESNEGTDTEAEQSGDTPENGANLENFGVGEMRVGDEKQNGSMFLTQVDTARDINIYIDVTKLTETNVGVDDLGVVAESRHSTGWLVSDAEITKGEQMVIQVTVTFDSEVDVDERGGVQIELTGLETSNAEHNRSLNYSATISTSNGEPDFAAGKTASFEIVDTEQIENVLDVSPSNIRIGETSQQVGILIDRATDEIEFRLDLTPLREIGVDIDGTDLVVEETSGERRNDEGEVEIEVTETAVTDGVVRLGVQTTADTLAVDVRINGLDTEEAEATADVTYPAYIGERPPEPTESSPFSISGATA